MSIPKDGYYTAWVQLDTGGTLPAYIRVQDGVIRDSDVDELRLDACSSFIRVSTQQFCGVWPFEAAMELEALRTSNAGLAEKVRRLEEASDTLIDAIQSVQCWNGTHVGDCIEQLESAKGQP